MTSLPGAFLRLPLAHRGLHDARAGRVENSRAAIRAAIAAGYGIEIDLHPSRDGQAMVFHDHDLNRLTGATGPLRAQDAARLGQIALTGTEEGIPTFAEILRLVAGRVPLLVELKDQQGAGDAGDATLESAVAGDLAGYDGPLALMSFNPAMVRNLADLAPGWPRGLVTCAYSARKFPRLPRKTRESLRAIADFDAAGCSFISHEARDLSRPRVAELKRHGAGILCWTIRSPRAEAAARAVAHNITFEGYLPAIPS